ncbi:hypothetical protein [Flagellimonas flava]|uniref:hypothetical protein n=1 Tax=Flagellimonas flava TaxID=570519 RepID=UPI003D654F8A
MVGYSNTHEYELVSDTLLSMVKSGALDDLVIPEPVNYKKGIGNIYERDKDSKGFLKTKSNDLEFHNEGKDRLILQKAAKGLSEDIFLRKKVKDPYRKDERLKTVSETFLDLGELQYDEHTAKMKATQGGLFKILDTKKSDEFDLMDTTAINGADIGALNRVSVLVDGRDILRISKMKVEDGTLTKAVVTGVDGLNARTPPFDIIENSDSDHINGNFGDQLSAAGGTYATLSFDKTSNTWYYNADLDTVLKINGRIELRIRPANANPGTLSLDVVKYQNGIDQSDPYIHETLVTGDPNIPNNIIAYDFVDYELPIKKGESVAFGVLTDTDDGVWYEWHNTQLEVREDSTYPASNVLGVTYNTLGERLVAKITGESDCIDSTLFESGGLWAGHVVTQGFWAREFPDIIQEGTDEERKIQFTTSLNDFLAHLYAIKPIAWWTEKKGNKEILRIELLTHTQQNFIGIKYATFHEDENGRKSVIYIQPSSKVKRKTLKDNFYSTITLGSELGGEGYEEVAGLQSISGKASWSTINNKNKAEYKRLTPYALGDIDLEIPRRKPFTQFPDVDTRYDNWKIVMDCKIVGNGYYLKKLDDFNFEYPPKNVYRVDTAFNLDFTPAKFFLNHSSEINVGLFHNSTEKVYFNSSNCNSSFISKKVGEDELAEDAPIPHSRLDKPRIRPTSVDFDLEVDDELEELITGSTNGIPNWFGLVAVETGGGVEYMRLVKVDTNKEGKHKLVEAYT